MSAINDGGSAFPTPQSVVDVRDDSGRTIATRVYEASPGMTLRDYAAIKFIAAILANPASYDKDGNWRNEHETAAECGLLIADDFIDERNKEAK